MLCLLFHPPFPTSATPIREQHKTANIIHTHTNTYGTQLLATPIREQHKTANIIHTHTNTYGTQLLQHLSESNTKQPTSYIHIQTHTVHNFCNTYQRATQNSQHHTYTYKHIRYTTSATPIREQHKTANIIHTLTNTYGTQLLQHLSESNTKQPTSYIHIRYTTSVLLVWRPAFVFEARIYKYHNLTTPNVTSDFTL